MAWQWLDVQKGADFRMKSAINELARRVQSVTADFYSEEDRGRVFGTLHLTSAAGAAFGGLYATNMGAFSMTTTQMSDLL